MFCLFVILCIIFTSPYTNNKTVHTLYTLCALEINIFILDKNKSHD